MKKVLILSDSCFLQTGYATIAKNIANGLAKAGFEVHYISDSYKGQTIVPGLQLQNDLKLDFFIHGSGIERHCKDLLQFHLKTIKPDYFFVLLDTFMLYPWLLEQDLSPAKSVFYFPTDGGGGLPIGCDQILKKMTKCIAMSRFGKKQVKDYHNLDVTYIPHAIDKKYYYPLPKKERDELRAKWGFANKFVVGCVARNQPRKCMDRTIKAFARFAKSNPDAVLLLHSDPYDAAAGIDLVNLIRALKIENRVLWTGMKWFKGFEYSEMNKVYNLMDCFFMLTSGEGFGIPIIEAQACGVPVVCTDYTTTHELVIENGQSGEAVKLSGVELKDLPESVDDWNFPEIERQISLSGGDFTGTWGVERGMACVKDASDKLQKIHDSPELREEYGKNGIAKVAKYYDWDVVLPSFIKFFEDL